jgi:TatD DNase family protein
VKAILRLNAPSLFVIENNGYNNLSKTTMQLIDSHCHLDLDCFNTDREQVLIKAQSANISDIIIPAIQASQWEAMQAVAQQSNLIPLHISYGLHPMFMQQHHDNDLQQLRNWLDGKYCNHRPIAVGECGLDFFIKNADKPRQLEFFEAQVQLSCEFDLPLIIHARKSLDFVLKILRKYPSSRGVVHCFSGSEQQARQLIERGFYLGFGGGMTYPRAKKIRYLAANLPLETLLLETDAPDQADQQHQGKRNEPAWLLNIAKTLAELRQDSINNIADVTSFNAQKLFSLKG